jgi:hypothetical protein
MSDVKRLLDAPSALDERARTALLAGRRLDPSRRDRDALWQNLAAAIALPLDVGAPAGPAGPSSPPGTGSIPPAAAPLAPPAAALASGASAALGGAKAASVGAATKLASTGAAALKITSAATGASAAFKIASVGGVGLALAFGAHTLSQPRGATPSAVISQGATPPLPPPLDAAKAHEAPPVALLEPAPASAGGLGGPLEKVPGAPANARPAELPLPPALPGLGGASPRAGATPLTAPLPAAPPRAVATPPAGAIGGPSKISSNEATSGARPERVDPAGRAARATPPDAALSAGGQGEARDAATGARGEARDAVPGGARGGAQNVMPAGARGEMRDVVPAGGQGEAATPTPVATGSSVEPARAAAALADDDVIAESRQVGEARRRLRAGDAAGALAALDGLARRFPRSVLAQERALLRVEALAGAGRRGEARAEAEAFVRAYPKSPFEGRVRALSR